MMMTTIMTFLTPLTKHKQKDMNHLSAFSRYLLSILFTMLLSTVTLVNAADLVTIENAWVRSTLPGQDVGAAYMTLTSPQNMQLMSVESDVTKSVEIHSMRMQNGVMKMRMLKELSLIANKPYQLAPGGHHLMLFDLKKPLAAGDQVNFTLTFKSGSQVHKQTLNVNVKSADDAEHNSHDHHHHH